MGGGGGGHCGKSSKHLSYFRLCTLNLNTLKERVCEVVETLSRRKVDLCCIQETRYWDGHCCIIKGKYSRYKLFWFGHSKGTASVGVFVAEKWIEKVFEVKPVYQTILVKSKSFSECFVFFLSMSKMNLLPGILPCTFEERF